MFSATDFLPACITEFMNLLTTTLPNFGSGRISRLSALWRRDISSLSFVSRSYERKEADYFGLLAPYFDLRCLRFLTPWVSSTPRRM